MHWMVRFTRFINIIKYIALICNDMQSNINALNSQNFYKQLNALSWL